MTLSNGNFFRVLALCAGNSPVTCEFPTQRPVTRSFDIFVDLRLNKWFSKQSWGWGFEKPPWSLWRHRNASLDGNRFHIMTSSWVAGKSIHYIPKYMHTALLLFVLFWVSVACFYFPIFIRVDSLAAQWLHRHQWSTPNWIDRITLHWCHNGRHSVLNHRQLGSLFKRLITLTSPR